MEDWADCEFAFHEMLVTLSHHMIVTWEDEGVPRAESFRLLIEYATRCMAYEVTAQELCDVLIEKKIGRDGWTLGDCLGGLVRSRWLASWRNTICCRRNYRKISYHPSHSISMIWFTS